MGATPSRGTPGNYTPICNDCGVTLEWEMTADEYEDARLFWDEWRCDHCRRFSRTPQVDTWVNRKDLTRGR